MFVLDSHITIGGKRFKRVAEVQIESSAKTLEDTAVIKIPTTARLERAGEYVSEVETAKSFKVGDPVVIQLGYDGKLQEEFVGYVSRIRPNIPIEIECEDSIWLLKRRNLKKTFRSTTLKKVIEYILEGSTISLSGDIPTINFDHFYLKDVSAAKALQDIKDRYGLTIYLKSPTELFVGLANENDGLLVKYRLGYNVITSDLEWSESEDVSIRIKAIHVRKDNSIIEKLVGDPEGELRTLYFYDIGSGEDLERVAQEELLKHQFSGYRGSFKTFLLPNARVGNIARIRDDQFSERDGDYLIDKVETSFGTAGARRKITPGIKVSD